jgi:hypothetical protein
MRLNSVVRFLNKYLKKKEGLLGSTFFEIFKYLEEDKN